MEFYKGQIFDGIYPPEAAIWCNTNNAYIVENDEGKYEIKAISEPTEEETIAQQVAELKAQLSDTDYMAIKFAEGWINEEEYEPMKAYRQELRDKINELENRE